MIKVLIVDDQAGWRNFHNSVIQEILPNDTLIDLASSAHEGYEKLLENADNQYDYMITDMQMEDDYAPKMAGEWLIEQAYTIKSCSAMKIIIISASPKIKMIAEQYGVFYISKSNAVISLDVYKELIHTH